jgi:DNA-binding transcriptional MerR regulator
MLPRSNPKILCTFAYRLLALIGDAYKYYFCKINSIYTMSALIKTNEKMFYSIGEVAEMFRVNTSLIRFWEKEFDCIKPFKNKKGIRYFTVENIETFRTIFYLVKECGYTLQGAKDRLAANKTTIEKNVRIYDSLAKIKAFLVAIKSDL